MLDRRTFTLSSLAFGASAITLSACGETSSATETNSTTEGKIEPMQTTDETMDWANLSRADWENRLTEEEFYVLRQEGTERPWSSELKNEKQELQQQLATTKDELETLQLEMMEIEESQLVMIHLIIIEMHRCIFRQLQLQEKD